MTFSKFDKLFQNLLEKAYTVIDNSYLNNYLGDKITCNTRSLARQDFST